LLRKIKAKYRESGLNGVLLSILRKLPGIKSVCIYYVYRLPFSKLSDNYLPLENVRVVLVDEDSIEHLIKIQNKHDTFRERFNNKHYCFLAYANDDPVAYLWAQHGPLHKEQIYGFEVKIAENQIYYYDSHTISEWRRKGLLRFIIQKTVHYFKTEPGINELIAVVETGNISSQKAHEKIGFLKDRLEFYSNFMGRSFQFKLLTTRLRS
jgi:RimJ/RimL family protein N-acetyltransferase